MVERSKPLVCDHSSPHPVGSSPGLAENFHVGRSSSWPAVRRWFYPYMRIFVCVGSSSASKTRLGYKHLTDYFSFMLFALDILHKDVLCCQVFNIWSDFAEMRDLIFSIMWLMVFCICILGFQSHRHLKGHMATSSFYWWRKTPHTRIFACMGRTTDAPHVSWKTSPHESFRPNRDSNPRGEGKSGHKPTV